MRRSNFWVLAIVLIAGLELAGTFGVPMAHSAAIGPQGVSAGGPKSAGSVSPAVVVTHGDLVVPSGKTVYLPMKHPAPGASVYYQGGNITVDAGGKLVVQNTTLSFVQFVGDSGIPAVRLSHIYRLVDHGKVAFHNSTLTTDAFTVNPYPKLTIVDDGAMTFSNSTIETAGFLSVGAGGDLTVNNSNVRSNPNVRNLTLLPKGLAADFNYSATLDVAAGGQASLLSSVYTDLYANNLSRHGTPAPLPLAASNVTVESGQNWSTFSTPTDSLSVMEDYLYPSGIASGLLTISYNDKAAVLNTTSYVTVWYAGKPYGLGFATFLAGNVTAVTFPFPSNLTSAVDTTGGMMGWLNRTGDFGLLSGISVAFHVTAGPDVPGTDVAFQLDPPLAFGPTVTGSGSRLSTVNSFLGLNFSSPVKPVWYDHNLTVADGATAYLANLTVAGELQNRTTQYNRPAIVVQGTDSQAYLYRWGEVQLYGRNGTLPVPGALLAEQYAYGLPQADNTTAKTINNLHVADPAIYDYLQYWDAAHGTASYGMSGPRGVASLLLGIGDIYAASMPGGDFLGNYHVIVTPPTGAGGPRGMNVSFPSYPSGVAFDSYRYGLPISWGTLRFPGYYASATVSSHNGIVVTANKVVTTTIRIGQELGVAVNVTDNGAAPITSLDGTLYYNATSQAIIATVPTETVDLTLAGQHNVTVKFSWLVSDTVVGLHRKTVADALAFVIGWNVAGARVGEGSLTRSTAVQFAPSQVGVHDLSADFPPSTALSASKTYFVSGVVTYNGSQPAIVSLTAAPAAGGTPIFLGSTVTQMNSTGAESQSSTVTFTWKASVLHPGTSYVITFSAEYNGVTTNKNLPGTYSVPTSAPSNFLLQKFLGEPLWVWLAIVAAVVVALVAFLLVSRRQAAGKLVECGECGNLIPEDAKVCPKCGAEFESDVVRCSRCSSTIPAQSKFCPECAAQLLGKPGEEGLDPERQAYADFTERFRAEAKKELGENYGEGPFWDWWKRQPSYTPFSQWKLQQGQGTPRAGMTAPPPGSPPPGGAAPDSGAAPRRPRSGPKAAPPTTGAALPSAQAVGTAPPAEAPLPSAGSLRPCPNCGKEIPPEYLVCPFCGSVTQ